MSENEEERWRRWRLILGEAAATPGDGLSTRDRGMDESLAALYDAERTGGLGDSSPDIARWLGDIRDYFPSTVVRVMQQDALTRLNLRRMLFEPELLAEMTPDVQLVAQLLALNEVMPERTRATARQVVAQIVAALQARLTLPIQQAVRGSLHRASRRRRPRGSDINWGATVLRNLKHYQPELKTVIPEELVGYGRRQAALKDVILAVDQSGSMAASVVYAGVCGAVLASLPALTTQLVLFDTAVVDMTAVLHDPVDLLFGARLGGGTDINRALAYCQGLVRRPEETILVLITDLFEGGDRRQLVKRVRAVVDSGVQLIVLLALNDKGAPGYDHRLAAELGGLGVPSFACTPDLFPDLMATAIQKGDVTQWAAREGIVVERRDDESS